MRPNQSFQPTRNLPLRSRLRAAELGREAPLHKCDRRCRVAKHDKFLDRILRGTSDANIAFEELRRLLKRLGFAERIRGDHYIFTKAGVEEILNLQPQGAQAKPYQVKQIRAALVKYCLAGGTDEK